MGFYVPSIYTLLGAFAVIGAVFASRASLLVLAIVSLVILIIATYQHYLFFGGEYRSLTMVDALIPFVPYIMVGAIVFFSTIYILFLQGPSNAGPPSAASPASSGFFGSIFGSSTPNTVPSARSTRTRYSPNYSSNYDTDRSRSNTDSLQRDYLSALDRGI